MEQEISEFSSEKIASERQQQLGEGKSSETEDFGNENDEKMAALRVNQEIKKQGKKPDLETFQKKISPFKKRQ